MTDHAPRGDNVRPLHANGRDRGNGNGHDKPPRENSIRPLDLVQCMQRQPPPRSWVIRDWIPRHSVTLFAGVGGIGKSLVAQQIATSIAANRDWIGQVQAPGSVLYLACEEEPEELWRRQAQICESMAVPMRAIADDLLLDGRTGLPNELCQWHRGDIGPTLLTEDVRNTLAGMAHPQLLIIDNIAHAFSAGESGENDRSKVARFLNMLAGLGREYDIGVLLLGHPGKNVGSQYSGSTGWNDLVRSRLFLGRKNADAPLRLSRPKGNYSGTDDEGIALEWEAGAFAIVDWKETPLEALASAQRGGNCEEFLLGMLDYFTAREQATSDAQRATNYLPRLVIERHKSEGYSRAEMADALLRLLDQDAVRARQELPWRGANRVRIVGLVRNGSHVSAYRCATDEQPMSNGDNQACTSVDP